MLLLLLLAAGAAGFLLRTTAGAHWLASRLVPHVPGLSLRVEGGSLWRGLRLREVAWRDIHTSIALDSVDASWRFSFRPRPAIRIHHLHADGLRLTTVSAAPVPPAPPAEKRPFHLPIFIAFEDLRLRDAHLRIDTLDLRLGSIEGRGRIQGNRLDIDTARLLDADLRDDRPRPPPPPPLPWYDALAPDRRPAIDLPDIHLPLDVRVQSFEMDRATLDFGGEPQRIHALRFSADGLGDQLTVRRLRLDHELGVAEAAGDIQLSGDYPLDLSVQLRSEHLLPPHALSLDSRWTGSLAELRFTASLDGIGALEASGVIHPLDPRLPIKASLAWAELAWPLEGPPIAASPSGRLALEGTLDDYSLELDAKLSGPSIPDGHWSLRANGDLHQLVLAPLRSELLGGSLQIDGALSWTNGVVWEASLAAETLDAAALHPKAPAQVAAQATSTGRWSPDGWQVDIDVASATGDWRGYPLALDGRAEGSSAVGWRTPGLRIAVRENHVLVAGSFADELDFSGELSLPDPGEFLPGLTGQVEGTWALHGPPATPDVILSLRAERIAYLDQIQLDAARIETSIASLAFAESRIRIELDSLSLPAQNLTFHSIRLQGDGTRIAHRTTLDAEGENASLSLVLHGALQEDTFAWTGTLDRAALAAAGFDWSLAEPLPLRWDSATHQLVAVPHRWRHAQAELSATQPLVLGASGSAQLQLAGFDLAEFHPWLPEDIRLRGTLAAAADLRWAPGALPQGEVSLDLREAGICLVATNDLYIDDAPPLDVAFESIALRARLAETNFSARFDLVAPGLGTARAQASATLDPDQHTVAHTAGTIDLDALQLDIAQPFLPELATLSGEIHAAIRFSGPPRRPLLHGTVSLTNGILEPAAFPVTLGDLHLQGELHGDRAEWSGGFRSGGGLATLQGDMALREDAWHAELRLSGNRLDLAYGTLATLQATPDLRLRVEPRQVSLNGTVLIPQADITIQQLPETAVRPSADALLVDDLPSDAPADAIPTASPWSRSIDLDLQLGDRVAIGGYGITGRLAGNLRLLQENHAVPRAFGELRIEDGRYRAYGQRLQIRRGQFLFAGPIDQPSLSIEAIRDVPAHNVVAGLRVEGHPDALQSSLFSEPAMPEEDVLAFLLLGRPLAGGEETDTNVLLARAAIALGIAGGGGTVTSLAETLGIEQFQLDTAGEGDDTQVVVSGYVSSRLQLSYGVGVFVPANTLTLRYRLARSLFLEAASGIESALDLLYTFRF